MFISMIISAVQLEPALNGPFTPDLANPISKIGENAQKNGWPMEVKVGEHASMFLEVFRVQGSKHINTVVYVESINSGKFHICLFVSIGTQFCILILIIITGTDIYSNCTN